MSSQADTIRVLALLYAVYKNAKNNRRVCPSLQSTKPTNGSRLLEQATKLDFRIRSSFHNFLRSPSSDFECISCKIEP